MTSILLISLAILLALYIVLAKPWRSQPRKARKQEKAEIMRQLLALADSKTNISTSLPPARSGSRPTKSFTARQSR